jgi:hypothetical protein
VAAAALDPPRRRRDDREQLGLSAARRQLLEDIDVFQRR